MKSVKSLKRRAVDLLDKRPALCPGCCWLLVKQGRARATKRLCADCQAERRAEERAAA